MRIKSLTARVLLLTTLWSAVALVVIGLVISNIYRKSAERGFQDLLRAQLYNVINSVTIGDQGALSGSPQLGDLRFTQPKTGWYWMVEPLGTYTATPLVSPSLGASNLTVLSVLEAPFDKHYERSYIVTDAFGNRVQVAETEVQLDTDHAARFRVTGNVAVVEDDVRNFSQSLYFALVGFGVGSLIVNALAILYGLMPLDKARAALERIRAGESERLQGDFPREILPLANEVNALIESNRRIVERARMQVGNLAHSLKTPIAVLLNESRVLERSHGDLVKSQAEAMQGQVQSYLNRARIAAQRESVLARTEAEPALERLVRVMRRLNADKEFELSVSPNLALAMEQQDLEETVGNLLENAARFAEHKVRVAANEAPAEVKGIDPARRHWVELVVEDDGPGLEPDQIREAMKRGRRLDESKPGTGLGLSIVSEIINEYQGRFELSRGPWGGLRASLILPGVTKDVA
ncbi:HAMP domain-containing histidine kinase [Rhizobium rhizogenes]|uniref:histidine kinase n=1 Tax=Rhizobium rhizogenes (strain K84 / ATCC BAA-868) TaxID=311403 RepID=B9JBL0_RHIR8|nr:MULTISPECIES: HAMP domain-containing sensor histidine kinase [Rhizobium]ACM25916.1 two-component sensor histidine kinase protein [Rhizobium rhizogenes K84]OCJ25032.1 histidine kinase [Agrobacterium sp. B131/95]EJK84934.1 signal transduction histidine kinase [Rhizobium sp. AP16]MDJ1632932.1 HAMP domain-containing sensor histidine kinase [Rhizobium rhizogenes]NTH11558.1 HAMP domain-containing histidine kinase [Rhizobium rhizogenes]